MAQHESNITNTNNGVYISKLENESKALKKRVLALEKDVKALSIENQQLKTKEAELYKIIKAVDNCKLNLKLDNFEVPLDVIL